MCQRYFLADGIIPGFKVLKCNSRDLLVESHTGGGTAALDRQSSYHDGQAQLKTHTCHLPPWSISLMHTPELDVEDSKLS